MKPLDRHINDLEAIVARRPLEDLLETVKKRTSELRIATESLEDDGWRIREREDGSMMLAHPFLPKLTIHIAITGFVCCKHDNCLVELTVEKDDRFNAHTPTASLISDVMKRNPREEILRAIEAGRLLTAALSAVEQAKIRKKTGYLRFLDPSWREDRRMLRGEPIFARISSTQHMTRDRRASDIDGIIAELRKG